MDNDGMHPLNEESTVTFCWLRCRNGLSSVVYSTFMLGAEIEPICSMHTLQL
uniref:Uncharacterized protein n=1 Tax=Aegilops tauschii subsp. strangulata TaxID=200361 RepID=A0A453N2X1_AEGTS